MSIEAKVSLDTLKLALEALVKLSDAADGFSVSGVYFNEEHWAKECLNKSYDAITALRQSIEQAQKQECYCGNITRLGVVHRADTFCDEHPEQAQKQEPVAWRFGSGTWLNREVHWRYINTLEGTEGLLGLEPLYTSPPQRQPLTDEQIMSAWDEAMHNSKDAPLLQRMVNVVRAIEAAHGIKE